MTITEEMQSALEELAKILHNHGASGIKHEFESYGRKYKISLFEIKKR